MKNKRACTCPCCGKTVIINSNCKNKDCYLSGFGFHILPEGVGLNDVVISKKQVDEYCKAFNHTDRNVALRVIHIDTALNCKTTKHPGLDAMVKAMEKEKKIKNNILYNS